MLRVLLFCVTLPAPYAARLGFLPVSLCIIIIVPYRTPVNVLDIIACTLHIMARLLRNAVRFIALSYIYAPCRLSRPVV